MNCALAFAPGQDFLPAKTAVPTHNNPRPTTALADRRDDLLQRPEWVDYWTLQFADLMQNRKVLRFDPPAQRQKGIIVKDAAELVAALKQRGVV